MHRRILIGILAAVFHSAGTAHGAVEFNIVALDVLPGGAYSQARGLNLFGQIVGEVSSSIGPGRPVMWNYGGVPHELWSNQLVGGTLADINNSGEIVGRYGSGSGIPLPTSGVPYGRAFYWNSTVGLVDIGFEPFGNSEAVAVNQSGKVVGASERLELVDIEGIPQPMEIPHAFIWDAIHGIRSLGDLSGGDSFANDINSHGQVVGYGDLANGEWGAFAWDDAGGFRQLPTLAGGSEQALAINDSGQVLGFEIGVGGLVWDLNDGSISIVQDGLDMNNLGQIVGADWLEIQRFGIKRTELDSYPS